MLPNVRIWLLMNAILCFMFKLTMRNAADAFVIVIIINIIIAKYIIKERYSFY